MTDLSSRCLFIKFYNLMLMLSLPAPRPLLAGRLADLVSGLRHPSAGYVANREALGLGSEQPTWNIREPLSGESRRVTVPWSWEGTSALRPLSFMSLWLTPQLPTRKTEPGASEAGPRPGASRGEVRWGAELGSTEPRWPRRPLRAVCPARVLGGSEDPVSPVPAARGQTCRRPGAHTVARA